MASKRKWEGYTLEELRIQRAMVKARTIVVTNRLERDVEHLRGNLVNPVAQAPSLALRLFKVIGTADWLMLGIRVLRRIAPLLKKKKRV